MVDPANLLQLYTGSVTGETTRVGVSDNSLISPYSVQV